MREKLSISDINIVADKGESLFSGNYAETNGVKTSNAIYMSGADLNLSSINNGTITFDDGIDGTNYNINIKTDEGIAKADGEIKEWIKKLNDELKDEKIKIEFDIPKEVEEYFQQLHPWNQLLKYHYLKPVLQ